MKLSAVVLGVVLVGLGACATGQLAAKWYKAGSTAADYQKDSYDCERDTRAGAVSFGGGLVGSVGAQNFYDRCMQAHGYYLAPG